MKLRYKYRIYPNIEQIQHLIQAGGSCRYIWNKFLERNQEQYKTDKKFVWFNQMSAELTKLKQELSWLKDPYSQSLQATLRHLDRSLKDLKRGKGFPRFKSKYNKSDTIHYPQGTRVENGRLVLPKMGGVKIILHRPLPEYTGVVICQEGNKWFASFVVDREEIEAPNQIDGVIGIDLNSNSFVVSDGKVIANPRFLKQKRDRVKHLQRKLSRSAKRSRNRERARARLAALTRKISRRRTNFIHQESSRIAKGGVLVCFEDLNIAQMKKNHPVAIAISDAGWRMFINAIEYKSRLLGGWTHKINRFLPSSKICNGCGWKKDQLSLDTRSYECDSCGQAIDRDLNAALNIRDWGLQEFCSSKGKSPQELRVVPLDVMAAILSSDGMTATQMKEEAKCSLDTW